MWECKDRVVIIFRYRHNSLYRELRQCLEGATWRLAEQRESYVAESQLQAARVPSGKEPSNQD